MCRFHQLYICNLLGPKCHDAFNSYNTKKSQTKIADIHKDFFELFQFFMNSFLCQTVSKSSFYILTKLLAT